MKMTTIKNSQKSKNKSKSNNNHHHKVQRMTQISLNLKKMISTNPVTKKDTKWG